MNYRERRRALRRAVKGPIWLEGSGLVPRNYPANPYPFRQNSHFLYYTGLSQPGLGLLIDDRETLVVPPTTMDDVVWSGAPPAYDGFDRVVTKIQVPRGALRVRDVAGAIVRQRSVKSPEEIREIEKALEVTAKMHRLAARMATPGRYEHEIAAAIQGFSLAQAYPPIVTVRGEVLHNTSYDNRLERGQLLLVDAGAEAPSGYASDITRVTPVGGRFTRGQRDIYDLVLRAQEDAIAAIRPGMPYREIHLVAARAIASGLVDLGLMRGDPLEAVAAGAHALFFPHGVGHMLGLDVHDMEDLGDVVGYGRAARDPQFGLNFLRLARPLEAGFVVTVEPGIYFIPALLGQWRAEGRHRNFIAYGKLDRYRRFGGIRIEDDVLVTPRGARVLGPGIPK